MPGQRSHVPSSREGSSAHRSLLSPLPTQPGVRRGRYRQPGVQASASVQTRALLHVDSACRCGVSGRSGMESHAGQGMLMSQGLPHYSAGTRLQAGDHLPRVLIHSGSCRSPARAFPTHLSSPNPETARGASALRNDSHSPCLPLCDEPHRASPVGSPLPSEQVPC